MTEDEADKTTPLTSEIEQLRKNSLFNKYCADLRGPEEILARVSELFEEMKDIVAKKTGTPEERFNKGLEVLSLLFNVCAQFEAMPQAEALMKKMEETVGAAQTEEEREKEHFASYEFKNLLGRSHMNRFVERFFTSEQINDFETRFGGDEAADETPDEFDQEMVRELLGHEAVWDIFGTFNAADEQEFEKLSMSYVQRMILLQRYPADGGDNLRLPDVLSNLLSEKQLDRLKQFIEEQRKKYNLNPTFFSQ